jgi:hypothetical protein
MSLTRHYMFHGHAAALGGRLIRIGEGKNAQLIKDAFVDLPASALTVAGGRSSADLEGTQINGPVAQVVRFKTARLFSEGVFDDVRGHMAATMGERDEETLSATTRVRVDIAGLEMGLADRARMLVKLIAGGFTSRSTGVSGETPVQLDRDTRFDGVTFVDDKGQSYTLVVAVEPGVSQDHDTYGKLMTVANEAGFVKKFGHTLHLTSAPAKGKGASTASPRLQRTDGGAVQGTIVKPLRWRGKPFPGSTIDRNMVRIPDLGRFFFGEISIARQSRRVTMVRANLGSPVGATLAAGDFQDNGGFSL